MNKDKMYRILLSQHISEKAMNLSEIGQYVFKVTKEANKPDIKSAIEYIFDVKVKSVNVVNIKPERKRNMRGVFVQKGFKKAYVSLSGDKKINILQV